MTACAMAKACRGQHRQRIGACRRRGGFADAEPVGLVPKRRGLHLRSPAGLDLTHMPMVIDFDESWYIKPETAVMARWPTRRRHRRATSARGDRRRHRRRAHRDGDDPRSGASRTSGRASRLRCRQNLVVGTTPVEGFFWLASQAATASRPAGRTAGRQPGVARNVDMDTIRAFAKRHCRRRGSHDGDRKVTDCRPGLTSPWRRRPPWSHLKRGPASCLRSQQRSRT